MSSEPEVIKIKKRNRATASSRARARSPGAEGTPGRGETSATDTPAPEGSTPGPASADEDEDKNLPIDELIELRRLRRARQGIDVGKLNSGGPRRRRKGAEEGADGSTTTPEGLIKTARRDVEEDESRNEENKARRTVRQSNFTQQTNALDVDKHMMAYIEENIKKRRGEDDADDDAAPKPYDPQEELYKLPEKFRTQPAKQVEEGNVTNSLAMLTAIPEVDLGMDARLKNIEETEKAKQTLAETRRGRRNEDEERLAATRFFKPNLKQKSDADILRDAKLEAMGMRRDDHEPRRNHQERNQTATDEMVMERFKKRMRR